MSSRSLPLPALFLITMAACGAPAASGPSTVTIAGAPAASTSASAAPNGDGSRAAQVASQLDQLDAAVAGSLGAGSASSAKDGVATGTLTGTHANDGNAGTAELRMGGGGGPIQRGGGLAEIGSGGSTGGSAGDTKVRGPSVSVSIGSVAASVGSVADASSVTASMAPGFRRCLNKALVSDPTSVKPGAALSVTVQIGKDGGVLSATPSGGVGLPAPAIECIAARARTAQFAPPAGGSATLVIPLTAQVTQ